MANATADITLPDDPNLRGDVVLPDPVTGREALVRGSHDFHAITERVCKVNEAPLPPSRLWKLIHARQHSKE